MATENNPRVALWHDGLGRNTTQPLSAARHLLNSGWRAADEPSAKALNVEYEGDVPSESAPEGKTAKELKSSKGSSKSNTKSDDKEGDK